MTIRIDDHKATLLIPVITQAELEDKVRWADYKMRLPYAEFTELATSQFENRKDIG